ncbi:MAG TPA: chloride channel protein [Cyclobacteriaceae bacterium]|nr:chloride channel protein [Cyclobacteriaceae bacterium]
MEWNRLSSIRKEFDFRVAGRWLFYGLIVGVISGLGAILFQTLLELVKELAMVHWMGLEPGGPGGERPFIKLVPGNYNPLYIVLIPALGGLVAGFIIYTFAPEAEGHGTDEAIKAFHQKRGVIRPSVPIVKLIASIITIGSGGSGGREGPIAQIGAGFGSFLSMRLGLDVRTRRWLLAAGMGAGIGSIFRAPLAGAIFAAEVLYSSAEVEAEVLLPAVVSSIIAYSVYSFRFGWDHIFTNVGQTGFSNPLELIPYSIEALVLALAALLFVKSFYGIRGVFSRWNIPRMLKPAIGGVLTGIVTLVLISLTRDHTYVIAVMGGGYGILQEIFQNGISHISLIILLLVAAGKIATTSFSIGSGGSAGVFGPSMVIGGTLGAATGYIMQLVFPGIPLDPPTFAIVGMAGFFAAAANTPLSTIIMVSELTGNYELLLPSMWVCAISYMVARKWSIYKGQVPGKMYSQAHFGEYAHDLFETTFVQEAYKAGRSIETLSPDVSGETIIKLMTEKRQRIFPVTDEALNIIGVFTSSDITKMLLEGRESTTTAKDLMQSVLLEVGPGESIRKAQQIMMDNQVEELLVVDNHQQPAKIMGVITAADIIRTYNRKLSEKKFGSDKSEALPNDEAVLGNLMLKSVIEKGVMTIPPDATLRDLVHVITQSKRNIFPVVDEKRKYCGIILLNDVRKLMFDVNQYDQLKVSAIMTSSPAVVYVDDKMIDVLDKFEQTNSWNLPVIDRYQRYRGLVSKSTIFSVYRNQLLLRTGP